MYLVMDVAVRVAKYASPVHGNQLVYNFEYANLHLRRL
jgi:hypothetical protein